MSLNLVKTVVSYLKEHIEEKYTARQIAEWIFENFPHECQEKKTKSFSINSDAELIQQLVAEISAQRPHMQKKYPQVKTTEGRPRKYYFTEKTDSAELIEAEEGITSVSGLISPTPKEHDLYPLISEYLWTELNVYSKRINEKRSTNKRGPNGNKWLHPDIVGMEDLSVEWHREIKDCVGQYSDTRTKLWSFEVKRLINSSNVRESFFQAVSNSSWANYGYLVSAEIEGSNTLKELRVLSAAHGIGLIQLQIDNPAESQILIPSEELPEIDWDTANRLAQENSDFLQYIKLVRQFYQTGDPRPKDWDIPRE